MPDELKEKLKGISVTQSLVCLFVLYATWVTMGFLESYSCACDEQVLKWNFDKEMKSTLTYGMSAFGFYALGGNVIKFVDLFGSFFLRKNNGNTSVKH